MITISTQHTRVARIGEVSQRFTHPDSFSSFVQHARLPFITDSPTQ